MADKKISALTASTTPLAGTEVLPIVQGGSTVKVAVSDLTAGRAVSASSVTSTGNSTFNTAANIGWRVGARSDNAISAIYPTAVTPDSTNYALQASSTITYLNSPGATSLAVSDNAIATATATALTLPNANIVIGTAGKGITTGSAIPLGFGVNNAVTAMTIDTSNNVLINTTTQRGLFTVESASGNCRAVNVLVGTSIMDQFYFQGATTGNISTNGVSASYNTTSDARLKHDITDAPEASVLIDQMQVRAFKWNMDNSKQRYGFIAQELLGVAPEAVYVPEDADQMMSVDYAKLVPMLVKEIQSLRARVAQLEGK